MKTKTDKRDKNHDLHKKAYDEILTHLQDSELAARNKQYLTARTRAMNAVDCAAKWHKALLSDGLSRFADIEDCTWFILPNDPDRKKYFKCNSKSAIGRDYKSFIVDANELIEATSA